MNRSSHPELISGSWAFIRRLFIPIGLLLLIIGVFGRVVSHGYVNWDDNAIFPDFLPEHRLTKDALAWALDFAGGEWQPVAHLLHLLQADILGDTPQTIHLVSVGVHGLNGILIWIIALKLLKRYSSVDSGGVSAAKSSKEHEAKENGASDRISDRKNTKKAGASTPRHFTENFSDSLSFCVAMATALIMVHPLRVEPVAWASSQSTLWCGTWALMAIWSFLRQTESSGGKSWAFGILTLSLVIIGFLTKPVVAPVLVWLALLALGAPLRREEKPRFLAWGIVAVSFLVGAAAIIISVRMRQKFQDHPAASLVEWSSFLPRASYALQIYAEKTLFPTALSPFYGRPRAWGYLRPLGILGLILLAVIITRFRKNKFAFLCWVGVFAGLAPAIGMVKLGRFVAADRYTYLASFALVPIVAQSLYGLRDKTLLKYGGWSLAILSLTTFSLLSYRQVGIWQSPISLWSHPLSFEEHRFPDVYSNYGGALEVSGRYQEALLAYDKAIALDPLFPDAHLGRGVTFYRMGRIREAVIEAETATKLSQDYALAWQNLAILYFAERRISDAKKALTKALSLSPRSPELLYLSGQLKAEAGDFQGALPDFKAAAQMKPEWPEPAIAYGALHAMLGQEMEARHILEAVVAKHPTSTAARATLNQIIKSADKTKN